MSENSIVSETANLTQEKSKKVKNFLLTALLMLGISALLFGFCLFWQNKINFLAIINAFYFSGILLIIFGWYILMYNMTILAPFSHGFRSFFMIFFGRRPKQKYYEYLEDIKENPINKKYYIIPFITAVPNLLVAIIMNIFL